MSALMSTSDSPNTEKMSQRSNSFDSIPDAEFVESMVRDELNTIQHVSKEKERENKGELLPEPLLVPDKTRFVLFPIKHPDVSFPNLKPPHVIHSNLFLILYTWYMTLDLGHV